MAQRGKSQYVSIPISFLGLGKMDPHLSTDLSFFTLLFFLSYSYFLATGSFSTVFALRRTPSCAYMHSVIHLCLDTCIPSNTFACMHAFRFTPSFAYLHITTKRQISTYQNCDLSLSDEISKNGDFDMSKSDAWTKFVAISEYSTPSSYHGFLSFRYSDIWWLKAIA